MQNCRSKYTVLAIIFAATFAWPVHAEELAVGNCTWCHGTSAQGYTPAPRLAGQRAEYIERQLMNFGDHSRDNPFSKLYMWGAAANLSSRTARDFAVYFSILSPKAANDGHQELTSAGRTIYQEGIPNSNVVACIACHGPNAEGIRDIPRLAGLDYNYVRRRLEQWSEGYHSAAKFPMPGIASKLSTSAIESLASYLSFVK